MFFRGFFSKDRILFREYRLITRRLVFLVLVRVVTLTITYCLKLIFSFIVLQTTTPLKEIKRDCMATRPSLLLVLLRMLLGFLFMVNINYVLILRSSSGLN